MPVLKHQRGVVLATGCPHCLAAAVLGSRCMWPAALCMHCAGPAAGAVAVLRGGVPGMAVLPRWLRRPPAWEGGAELPALCES